MKREREYLREATERILRNDPELADKVKPMASRSDVRALAKEVHEHLRKREPVAALEVMEPAETADPHLALETIVQRVGRPVLLVQNDGFSIDDPRLNEEGGDIWKTRLFAPAVKAKLVSAIPAIGRVEVDNNPDYEWLGTGWLTADDVIVTNRHVASEFAYRRGDKFVYRRGFPIPNSLMSARVDFLEEEGSPNSKEFLVKDILYLAGDDEPDIALLKIEQVNGKGAKLADPLRLASSPGQSKQFVATIGYPAADSRVPDQDLVRKFFGDIYNKKRLAPGQILRESDGLVFHDCSTLGGNSGSPVLDLGSGEVVALHFSGLFLRENRAVAAPVLADILAKAKRRSEPPGRRSRETAPEPVVRSNASTVQRHSQNQGVGPSGSGASVSLRVQIPLEIQLTVGQPSAPVGVSNVPSATSVDQAVEATKARIGADPNVVCVRRGYLFENGWITDRLCVVVMLQDSRDRADIQVPEQIKGIPIQVRGPGVAELIPEPDFRETAEGVRPIAYQAPTNFSLHPVEERMKVVCHLSPDAGWPVLKGFLEKTESRLTIGMYDFTAPNVIEGVLDAVKTPPKRMKLVLQAKESIGTSGIKKDDWPETRVLKRYMDLLGDRFQHAPASVGKDRQFASAYHIKVAVRDGRAFWLSSGNWQSTNQYHETPAEGSTEWFFLTNLNREWHVVIENENLAKQFENFLSYDFENAVADEGPRAVPPLFDIEYPVELEARVPAGSPTYFKPLEINRVVKVTPLLTPDNYHAEALKLISSAEGQILFQNQSLNLQGSRDGVDSNDPRFVALYEKLVEKQAEGLDVRIIIRGDFNPETYLERLQDVGFDMKKVRLQNHCHTKGIVVDCQRVLLGSHNWTNEGTLVNRDASLLFEDPEIAAYYARAFLFDWSKLATGRVGAQRRVRRVEDGDEAISPGSGWRRVNIADLI